MPTGLFRRHPTAIVIASCSTIALLGILAYALALRDCRFAVPAGRCLSWSLVSRSSDLGADDKPGPERLSEHRLSLVGIGPDSGDAAQLWGSVTGPPQALQLVRVLDDGRVRQMTGDGRLGDTGAAVAGFDFNLLPLPPGAEQEWRTDVVWATLPADRHAVTCQVKRQRSGARPEFRCEFPASVEWLDPTTGRYRQVRGLIATYRFDTLASVPLSARIVFQLFDELPPPAGWRGRSVQFDLTWIGSTAAGEVKQLHTLALAGAVAEAHLAAKRQPPTETLQSLRTTKGPFAGLADSVLARWTHRRP